MGLHELEPTPDAPHHGTVGWGLLAAGVLAWDIFAPETLSSAVDRALEHPRGRYAAIGGVAVTSAHLLNLLPERYDPFVRLFDVVNKAR